MATPHATRTARCPDCDSRITFDELPEMGDLIDCPECDAMLEVVNKSPIRLDWADGDWDDDSDDDDDEEDFYEDLSENGYYADEDY